MQLIDSTITAFDMEMYTYEGKVLTDAVHYQYEDYVQAGGLIGSELVCHFFT